MDAPRVFHVTTSQRIGGKPMTIFFEPVVDSCGAFDELLGRPADRTPFFIGAEIWRPKVQGAGLIRHPVAIAVSQIVRIRVASAHELAILYGEATADAEEAALPVNDLTPAKPAIAEAA